MDRDEFCTHHELSPKETQIFTLLVQGTVTLKDLAQALGVSPETVRAQLKNIFQKTGTTGKAELLSAYVKFVAGKLEGFRKLLRSPQVIVVDDEPEIAHTVAEYLESRGVRAYAVSDPVEVPEMVRSMRVDVVVSDVQMPKMDGLALVREIRAIHRYLPGVILMSGNSSPERTSQAVASGAIALVEKPIELQGLYQAIMDFYIDDIHDQNRYIRIPDASPVRFDGAIAARAENIGYGGLFVPFENSHQMAVLGQYEVGQTLRLAIELADRETTIQCNGEIVWRKLDDKEGRPGIGIRFIEMQPEDRETVLRYVRMRKVLGLIPQPEA